MTAKKLDTVLSSQNFISWLGEDKYKQIVRFVLHKIADLDIPIKRSVHRSIDWEERERVLIVLCGGCFAVELSSSSATA